MALPKINQIKTSRTILPVSQKEVVFRGWTAGEERNFLMALEDVSGNFKNEQEQELAVKSLFDAVTKIIDSCVVTEGITSTKTGSTDLIWLLIQIRKQSQGSKENIKNYPCSSCKTEFSVDLDLDKVKVDIPENYNKNIQITDKVGVTLREFTLDAMLTASLAKNQVESTYKIIAGMIDSIYDNETVYKSDDYTINEILDFLDSIDAASFKKIIDTLSETTKIYFSENYDCSKCGHKNEIRVEGIFDFLG